MQGTKLPLTTWFLAIDLISQAKTGLSALALKRHLGASYPTAWLIDHKLMQAIPNRETRSVFDGQVQVDDAYRGGEDRKSRRQNSSNYGQYSMPPTASHQKTTILHLTKKHIQQTNI